MDIKKDLLLNRGYTLKILKKLNLPHNIRKHCSMVSNKGIQIAKGVKKIDVDQNLVEIGGLIHDIGRLRTHDLDHGILGGIIAREIGYPEPIARICETHVLGGLDTNDIKDFLPMYDPNLQLMPENLEEKIICLADKFFQGSKKVSIDDRFQKWFKKKEKNLIFLQKSKYRVEKIQEEIKYLSS